MQSQNEAEQEKSARKLFAVHVKQLQSLDESNAEATRKEWSFLDRRVDFVWIQGVIISENREKTRFVVEDGTGFLNLICDQVLAAGQSLFRKGVCVAVIGRVLKQGTAWYVVAEKIVDVSQDPNKDTMWILEVIESTMDLQEHPTD